MMESKVSVGGWLLAGLLAVAAQNPGGTGWLPEWADQLGISLEEVPAPDESFVSLKATVKDPAKVVVFLPGAVEGMTVNLVHSGYAAWTTEVSGKPVRPCVIVMRAEGSDREVRLVPDRKTRLLKLSPPPFRGSNLRPGNPGS